MSAVFRRTFHAIVLALILLTTGAWQSPPAVLAKSQAAGLPEAPLAPGLSWSGPVSAAQDIRVNTQGDSISLPGARYSAGESFSSGLPQEVLSYYSNEQLAKSGWSSYDVVEGPDGVRNVFYHESAGVYLAVELLKCPQAASGTCLSVWQSEPAGAAQAAPDQALTASPTLAGSFGKTTPANGSTGLNPTSVTLTWGASSGADKYSYCVQDGSACASNDPDWTSSYDRSVTVTNLAYGKTYYWQVRATDCSSCIPKPWTYANGGTVWTFKTKTGTLVTILGNAGTASATLTYTDSGVKTVKADSVGAYSLKVPQHWSGTLTPSKTGFTFSPASASFTDLTAAQTIQNFTATAAYTISGNTGLAGVTLSYTNGTPQTVVSNASGNYSIGVPAGWSGTVTPSKLGYAFSPAIRTYASLAGNVTAQNFTPTVATFTISGNAGTAGATLMYTNGTPQSVLSDGSGNYSITVPYGWSGTVTPVKTNTLFSPANRTYASVTANQTAQNYTATPLYSISGNAGAAGAILSYTDGSPKTVTSQLNGTYSFTVPGGWNGTVTPDHACFTFSPASHTYSNLASNLANQNFSPTVKAGCANVDVQVGGNSQGRFGLASPDSTRASFSGLNAGPVKIASSNAVPLIAGERVIFKVNNLNTSFSEVMALPNGQLDNTYWLPWYNNVDLDTQLRIANVSGSSASVHVRVAGTEVSGSPFTVPVNGSSRLSLVGVNGGPVEIQSNVNIVAAERVIYKANNVQTSFSETMALPNGQLDNTYWLPWYNNVDLDTQLRIANVSGSSASVHVLIAGTEVSGSPFTVPVNGSSRLSFAGVNSGPVEIQSNVNVVAAERVIYKVNGIPTSYSEMMALPAGQLDNTYWLPWYNNLDLDTQLRFANVTTLGATVHVFVGGTEVSGSPFILGAGGSNRLSFAGVSSGPVQIVSDQDIVVAERVIYKAAGGVNTSFSELMALPDSQLATSYWLPWYNNLDLDTQLRFGAP